MQRPLPALSLLAAIACAPAPVTAADIAPDVAPPARVVTVEPVNPGGATGCWRYGTLGWGWYPCVAGPPAYWHTYRYGWRPYWARHHGRKWGYW